MPPVKITRPRQRQQLSTGKLMDADPQKISRHLAEVAAAIPEVKDRTSQKVDLVVGDNLINHGLGRPALGATVTPSVADATFAWAMTATDRLTATITVVGVPQTGARVEVF